ncbi:MerR family transcriptional regulator [Anaerosacchariphilus polymeriproducens]|uniref:MerR family transcriptional regulator n=1 Tax=Anaerosacchariphilus polymeriproducens TaxID=1812858 RepID=A0A371AST9_9FIRM|nr:MerR family transcriptional regulator [Anaerosacchariphilus polymeriproducens]RDU22635.1 MerR family transcriptional regulator [Anaerosacchariphilus polymeriproducens]
MMTVNQVSKRTGVSVRTLHYYDKIGLLHPNEVTKSKYRLYDDTALERLQQILLFRELQFSLKEIKQIIDSPGFDKKKALEQQIALLQMKRERLDELINLAFEIKLTGVKKMDFSAFNTQKIDEYAKEAKEKWQETDAYKEFETKTGKYSKEDWKQINQEMTQIFAEFGKMLDLDVDLEVVRKQVMKLQHCITKGYYTCTNEILAGLGEMYIADGRMKDSIDRMGGEGTAEFVSRAIKNYCVSLS